MNDERGSEDSGFLAYRSSHILCANVHPRARLPGGGLSLFDFRFGFGEVDFPLRKNPLYNPIAPH